MWLPDVEVLNLKEFRSLDVLDKLQGLWVSQNSEVLYVLAARITFICAMTFEAFPLDIQTCLFQVSIYFIFLLLKSVFPDSSTCSKTIFDFLVRFPLILLSDQDPSLKLRET